MNLYDLGIRKGINLGGWMSQCDYTEERLNSFITEPDFAQIAAWGFDHVRLPVDFNIFQKTDGTLIETGFVRLDRAAALAEQYGLKLVLDLHKTIGFSFDDGEQEAGFFENAQYQELFYQLWEAFAARYGDRPKQIVFELLNEVTDASYIDAWNRIARECIRRIRVHAPETVILVGSYHNNSAAAVPALDPPYDARVIYNFHCYEPLRFTHQGAHWVPVFPTEDRVSFAESGADETYFEQLFAAAIAKAEQEKTTLYCGEYGVIDIVPAEDAVQWFRTIHAVLERHRIPRCVWSYKRMSFGISDPHYDAVRDELLQYL